MEDAPTDASVEEILIHSRRVEESLNRVPAAVGVVGRDDVQKGRQQLGLDESLVKIPGVFFQSRYNFGQDLRIAIRGFGVQSSFGIRGIKLLVDGIPATLPDGQGQVDSIDLGSTQSIEVLRGPSSSLYGQAAGGVISVTTEDGPPDPFINGRFSAGSYGYRKYQAKAGGDYRAFNYFASASGLELDGYRAHSRTENFMLNTKLRYSFGDGAHLTGIFNLLHSPQADDSGALTQSQVDKDRRQAAANNVLFNAGESVDQQQLGLVYQRNFGDNHELSIRSSYVWRDFQNRLPFESGGSVDLDRFFVGGGVGYIYQGRLLDRPNRLLAGIDIDGQMDRRKRFDNNEGVIGDLTLDQKEDVTSVGVYLQNEVDLAANVELTAGLRYDRIEFEVDDRFLTDGDASGSRTFHQWSPMVALRWSPAEAINPYATVSTSFATPTTTELANPSGEGGFNPDLEAQKAINFEVGVKGSLGSRARYELAAFHMRLRDDLIPFEIPGQPGRDFFVNAGRSWRTGIEFAASAELLDGLEASLAYTWSYFAFDEFDTEGGSFDGNRIPGIPENLLYAQATYEHSSGTYLSWNLLYAGSFYANNANTVSNDGYVVSNLWAGYVGRFGHWAISPFVGLNNLLNTKYNGNVRLNAFGGRYFEPAPTLNIYGGLSVTYHFYHL